MTVECLNCPETVFKVPQCGIRQCLLTFVLLYSNFLLFDLRSIEVKRKSAPSPIWCARTPLPDLPSRALQTCSCAILKCHLTLNVMHLLLHLLAVLIVRHIFLKITNLGLEISQILCPALSQEDKQMTASFNIFSRHIYSDCLWSNLFNSIEKNGTIKQNENLN